MTVYHFAAILIVSIWGTTFVATKVLLQLGFSPAGIFVIRFGLAYLGVLAACHKRLFCDSLKDELLMVAAGLAGGSLYFLTENTALKLAYAGNVALIVCLNPLLTALFALFVGKERKTSPRLWLGSCVAFAGAAVVAYSSTRGGTASHPLSGNLLAFCAAMLWAVYQLVVRPMAERYGVLLLTRKVFAYGLLTILPFLAVERPFELSLLGRPVVWGNLLFLGVVASLICYAAWNAVVEKLGSVVSATYIYLIPVVTCVVSFFVLNERLSASMMLGGAGVLCGLYLVMMPANKAKPNK